jgi:hypothetical protein
METIAFGERKYRIAEEVASLNHQDDTQVFLEDIVTIDSQIELKVRGEVPEIKVLNAANQFMEQKMSSYLKYAYEEFESGKQRILEGTMNFDVEQKENPAFEELRKFHLQKFTALAELKSQKHRKNKFLFSIQPGFEIIVPPYDSEWTNSFVSFSNAFTIHGQACSIGCRDDGKAFLLQCDQCRRINGFYFRNNIMRLFFLDYVAKGRSV